MLGSLSGVVLPLRGKSEVLEKSKPAAVSQWGRAGLHIH